MRVIRRSYKTNAKFIGLSSRSKKLRFLLPSWPHGDRIVEVPKKSMPKDLTLRVNAMYTVRANLSANNLRELNLKDWREKQSNGKSKG